MAKLVSHEGKSFTFSVEVAKMSRFVETVLASEGVEHNEEREIPLPDINAPILSMVIQFCQHHITDPMTAIEKVRIRPEQVPSC